VPVRSRRGVSRPRIVIDGKTWRRELSNHFLAGILSLLIALLCMIYQCQSAAQPMPAARWSRLDWPWDAATGFC